MAVLPYVYKYFVKNTFCGRQVAVNYVLYVKFERKSGGIIMGSIGIIIVYVVVIGAVHDNIQKTAKENGHNWESML